jgi:hypothetical protein
MSRISRICRRWSSDQLSDGNAKLETSRSTAQVAGPGLAGLLVGALKAPYAIAVDAASFVASALFMTRIEQIEALPEASGPRRMRTEIVEGLRFVLRHPPMRPALIWVATMNFFTTVAGSIVLVFAVRGLHLTAATVGLIFSLGNIGVLGGALLAPRIGRCVAVHPTRRWWARDSLPRCRSVVIRVLRGRGQHHRYQPLPGDHPRPDARPDERVPALRRLGDMPFAGLIGGALGSHLGLRPTLWIGAIGATVAFVPMLFSPFRRVSEHADAELIVRAINEDFASATAASTAV